VTDKSGGTLGRRVTPKMADMPVPGYQAIWMDMCKNLKSSTSNYVIGEFPDADAQLKPLFKVIRDIEEMARYTPASVGESGQCSSIGSTTKDVRQNFCKILNG
jgi:hypothetical protein